MRVSPVNSAHTGRSVAGWCFPSAPAVAFFVVKGVSSGWLQGGEGAGTLTPGTVCCHDTRSLLLLCP